MSELCVFCDEWNRRDNTFAETDLWRARWDPYPATPGHVEILPKRHVQYFEQLTADERDSMMAFTAEVMPKIRAENLVALYENILGTVDELHQIFVQSALDALRVRNGGPDAFNFGLNDGPVAGQSVPHFHLHIMPRWQGDMENPRGGVRNIFLNDSYKELR